jgi:hypothetical protein
MTNSQHQHIKHKPTTTDKFLKQKQFKVENYREKYASLQQ